MSGREWVFRPWVGRTAWLLLSLGQTVYGQISNSPPSSERVLTNIYEIWEIPRADKAKPFQMRTEMVIYYFDAKWNVAWGDCLGRPAFLPIADSPTPIKAGQRIAIEGVIFPALERFDWNKTRVRILEDNVKLNPQPIRSVDWNPSESKGRFVTVEGLIDRQMDDPIHITLNFLTGGTAVTAYVLQDTNGQAPNFKVGDFVRMKCVYSPQFDRDEKLSDLVLWAARPADIEVIGSLKTDSRFDLPVVASDTIRDDTQTNNLLHVEGVVRSHEPGKWITLWDATGQIMVQSRQTQALRIGERVEAIGYPIVLGVQQCLRGGLYRLAQSTNRLASAPGILPDQAPLRLAEQIRVLSRDEAARHQPVLLRAIVTWQHAETPFTFLLDASGGIRVSNPKWDGPNTAIPGTLVTVRGEVAEGSFVPVVTNAVINRAGWWNLGEARPVTLEQALTGLEDGRWVEMRGFVREITQEDGLVRLDLSTSSGEFEVRIPASQSFESLRGSVIQVQGVCDALANARHQLTGVQILTPEAKFIQVSEPAPDDLFATPLRPLGSLRRFNLQNALNQRTRTVGTVVLHVPGRYLCVQDGEDGVCALSQEKDELRPGDRVEVVGFPGNQGRRFLLREAVYRRTTGGAEPIPKQLPAAHAVDLDLEGLLAKAEGSLLNVVRKDGEVRLLVHTKDSAFEASLDSTKTDAILKLQTLELGSRLAVTGVYEVQSDEYGNPRSFLLRLRSAHDVRLLQNPPWWTLARMLWVLLGVLGISVVAMTWGFLISHKNKLLGQAQSELKVANDRLEHRVEERTRELQEQVTAKERARAELAEAQENLVLTSRQAGMAEVATGVLHNVGNVLNSVNVSTGVLSERLRRCSVESVAKAASLLHKNQDRLASFLTEDPKGKALPGFMEKLGDALVQDKQELQREIESLAKNIDHIKVIVLMQQSYAKIGGVLEELDPKDLLEDAVQINSATLQRNQIQTIRHYHPVPRVLVDRHKVLQILVNLVSNARYALGQDVPGKKLTLSIAATDPGLVRISVSDNGVGITPENMSRMFSHGFTTRKDGHGFGLHSGTITAKELGGSLTAHSEGLGHGATFVLELPAAGSAIQKPTPAPGANTTSQPSPSPA